MTLYKCLFEITFSVRSGDVADLPTEEAVHILQLGFFVNQPLSVATGEELNELVEDAVVFGILVVGEKLIESYRSLEGRQFVASAREGSGNRVSLEFKFGLFVSIRYVDNFGQLFVGEGKFLVLTEFVERNDINLFLYDPAFTDSFEFGHIVNRVRSVGRLFFLLEEICDE